MPGTIPSDFIQELLARTDIVEVINSRVPLKQAGREWKACCPFHNERTPSFYVNPAKQFYHCFGCGESGTAISFLMKYGNLQFRETIEELALGAGMKIPTQAKGRPVNKDYDRLLKIMESAQSAYRNELHQGENGIAREYLQNRNITSESAKKFGLGFAPERWDFLLNRLGTSAESRELLEKAGLAIRKDGNKEYDRFRNRLMFPIEDRRGHIIAFGGRIIGEGEPKYLNSPETILFKKSNQLFGLHLALPAIKRAKKVIVVEGYTDVVVLSQHGVENVVATLGVATSGYHVRELFRTAEEIVFCFDGDDAGKIAAWRAMESTLPMLYDGRLVSFVFLPEGSDPDTYVQSNGAESFEELVYEGEPIVDFIFRRLQDNVDIRRHDGQAKLIDDFVPIYSAMPDSILRELAKKQLMKFTESSEREIDAKMQQGKVQPVYRSTPSEAKTGKPNRLIAQALAVLIQNPKMGWSIEPDRDLEILQDPNIRLLVEVFGLLSDDPEITTASLVEKFRGSEHFERMQKFVTWNHNVPETDMEQQFREMMTRLHERVEKKKTRAMISTPKQDGDWTNEELAELQERLRAEHANRHTSKLH